MDVRGGNQSGSERSDTTLEYCDDSILPALISVRPVLSPVLSIPRTVRRPSVSALSESVHPPSAGQAESRGRSGVSINRVRRSLGNTIINSAINSPASLKRTVTKKKGARRVGNPPNTDELVSMLPKRRKKRIQSAVPSLDLSDSESDDEDSENGKKRSNTDNIKTVKNGSKRQRSSIQKDEIAFFTLRDCKTKLDTAWMVESQEAKKLRAKHFKECDKHKLVEEFIL